MTTSVVPESGLDQSSPVQLVARGSDGLLHEVLVDEATGCIKAVTSAATRSASSAIRADAVLTSGYVAGTVVPVPAGAERALVYCTYVGGAGSTNGAASHKVLLGDGAFQGTGPDGTYAVIAGVTAAAAATSKYCIGPVDVRGSSAITVSSAETGDVAHLGNLAVSVVFG